MERYTYIYGTIESGPYSPMGASDELPGFLAKIGAVNPSATIDLVRNEICGFKPLPGYEEQPRNDLPVAIRYAPFHLYKRPDMPKTMEPFCVVSVSGSENRPGGRNSVYSQIVFLSREHMLTTATEQTKQGPVVLNYLDQIFGTKVVSYQDMNHHRSEKLMIDYDALPAKVVPELHPQDWKLLVNVVSAVYADKAVVIRTEKGYGFNARAKQLLVQIYSMLQPRLASETGFATYQEPSTIRDLVANTSLRIFVLPAECELKADQLDGMLVMDLNDPATIPAPQDEELAKQLKNWRALVWTQRSEAMEALFADTIANYRERDHFVATSQAFFDNEFFKWLRSDEDKGKLTTLEEIKTKMDTFPLVDQIPWVKERFKVRLNALMEKGLLKKLTGAAMAEGLFAKSEDEMKRARRRYMFGSDLGGSDIVEACKATGALVESQVRAACAEELNAQKAQTEQAIADGQAAVAAEQEKAAAAAAAAASRLESEQLARKQEVEELQARANNALAAKDEECKAAVAAEQEKTQQAIASGQAAVAAEQEKTQQAIANGQAAVEAEKERSARAIAEMKKAKAELARLQEIVDSGEPAPDAGDPGDGKPRRRSRPKKVNVKKFVLIGAAIGFVTALILGGIAWGVVALLTGGKEDAPATTTQPTISTTQPAATTEPSEAPTVQTTAPTTADSTTPDATTDATAEATTDATTDATTEATTEKTN